MATLAAESRGASMRAIVLAIMAMGLFTTLASAQAPPAAPEWARQPTLDDLVLARPQEALDAGKRGQVRLSCKTSTLGVMEECQVLQEMPEGLGYGAAALALSRKYALTPDSAARLGNKLEFEVSFERNVPTDSPPDWLKRPTAEEMLSVYPSEAMRKGVEGSVIMTCVVGLQGNLRSCRAFRENPAGSGFGAAALFMASQFLMKPGEKNGEPVETAVTLPLTFKMPEGRGGYVARQRMIANATWLEAPTFAEMRQSYSGALRKQGVGGRAALYCKVGPSGWMQDCAVTAESPTGKGFGRAARQLAEKFRMAATDGQGASTTGAFVHIPITFPAGLGDEPPPISKPQWRKMPTVDDMAAVLPQAAKEAKVFQARVVLNCMAAAGGVLSACEAVSEEPAGLGYGAAAQTLGNTMQIAPWTEEGLPTVGGQIRFPLRFDLDVKPQAP